MQLGEMIKGFFVLVFLVKIYFSLIEVIAIFYYIYILLIKLFENVDAIT